MDINAKIIDKILAHQNQEHIKEYTSRPRGMYPWGASMVQHMQINE